MFLIKNLLHMLLENGNRRLPQLTYTVIVQTVREKLQVCTQILERGMKFAMNNH